MYNSINYLYTIISEILRLFSNLNIRIYHSNIYVYLYWKIKEIFAEVTVTIDTLVDFTGVGIPLLGSPPGHKCKAGRPGVVSSRPSDLSH